MPFRHIAPETTRYKVVHFTGATFCLWYYMIQCWGSPKRLKTVRTMIIKVQQDLIAKSALCLAFPYQLGAINVLSHAVATDFLKR